jgi:CubicO group peptidase (beta-lactamase class C family)
MIDEVIESALREERIVGCVVGVMHRGALVRFDAHGYADREAGRPMTPDAIFLLASATKPIATAAILAEVERGLVDLDAPVARTLPSFRPRFGDTEPEITLRHLLTHTSGLSYPFREPPGGAYHTAGVGTGVDQPGLSGDEQLRRLASVPLRFMPGTRWNYSLGVDVAGLAVAAACGRPLPDIVRETVTGPLRMRDTDFAVTDTGRLVAHYGVAPSGKPQRMHDGYAAKSLTGPPAVFVPSRLLDSRSYPSGGGGMAGTATDLLTFVECLRRGGAPVLSARSAALMSTNALPETIVDVLEPGWSYGVGTQVLVDRGRAAGPERAGAFKGSGGYGHTWFVDRELGIAAVALTNSAPEGVRGRFASEIRDAIYATFA